MSVAGLCWQNSTLAGRVGHLQGMGFYMSPLEAFGLTSSIKSWSFRSANKDSSWIEPASRMIYPESAWHTGNPGRPLFDAQNIRRLQSYKANHAYQAKLNCVCCLLNPKFWLNEWFADLYDVFVRWPSQSVTTMISHGLFESFDSFIVFIFLDYPIFGVIVLPIFRLWFYCNVLSPSEWSASYSHLRTKLNALQLNSSFNVTPIRCRNIE